VAHKGGEPKKSRQYKPVYQSECPENFGHKISLISGGYLAVICYVCKDNKRRNGRGCNFFLKGRDYKRDKGG
jgi:hypothetical protein